MSLSRDGKNKYGQNLKPLIVLRVEKNVLFIKLSANVNTDDTGFYTSSERVGF